MLSSVRAQETNLSCLTDVLPRVKSALKLDEQITRLFEELHDAVYRYLVAVLGSPMEAEEITQATFFRLYRFLYSGQSVRCPRLWIFRVAHNLAINERKAKHYLYLTTIDTTGWEELASLREDPRPNPEDVLLEREKYQRLRDALGRLSLQQQQCLTLRAEGLRTREIAEVLGINLWTAAKSLRRGIQRLTRDLHD